MSPGLCRETLQKRRWQSKPDELGMQHSREKGHRLGGRPVQIADDFQRRLPQHSSQMQIRTAPFPSERLPIGNGLLIVTGRGERLETCDHNKTNPPRHTGPAQRAEREGPGTSRSLYNILVRNDQIRHKFPLNNEFLQSKPLGIRETRQSTSASDESTGAIGTEPLNIFNSIS